MKPPAPEPAASDRNPGVPGFRTWRGIYVFILAVFALVVVMLAFFSRWFA
jgi:hypothetical protein